MLIVMSTMLAGVLLGRLLRPLELKRLQGLTTLAILALLFLMGAAVGGNALVMDHLPTIGGKGAFIGLAAMLGSACAAKLLGRWIGPRPGRGRERKTDRRA